MEYLTKKGFATYFDILTEAPDRKNWFLPNWFFKDRRRATRIPFDYPTRYKVHQSNQKWREARVVDISQGGVAFISEDSIPVGQKIELQIRFPQATKTFLIQGVIVWAKRGNDQRRTVIEHGLGFDRYGVSFSNLHEINGKEKIIHFLTDKLCHYAMRNPKVNKKIVTRPARTFEEVKTCFHLLYHEYRKRNYCPEHPSQLHYNYFCCLPESRTFLIEKRGKMAGTLSIFMDSPCGLPMEGTFPLEIKRLRRPGRKLAEVGLLALSESTFEKSIFSLTHFKKFMALFQLFRAMWNYARFAGATDVIIGINPKHKEIYHYLGFEVTGNERLYEGSLSKPAILMHLDYSTAHERLSDQAAVYLMHQYVDYESFKSSFVWDTEHVRELLMEIKPLWSQLDVKTQLFFKKCHPDIFASAPSGLAG